MSVIKDLAMAEPLVDVVEPDQVVADKPCLLHSLDMAAMPPAAGQSPGFASAFSSPFELTAASNNYVHALVAYFDVEFSACHKPLRFTTGPDARPTHWKQTVFYLEDTLVLKKGESVRGVFTCRPNAQNPRDLDIEIEYEVKGLVCQAKRKQHYRMR
jgi:type I protein arginine methyltransferase